MATQKNHPYAKRSTHKLEENLKKHAVQNVLSSVSTPLSPYDPRAVDFLITKSISKASADVEYYNTVNTANSPEESIKQFHKSNKKQAIILCCDNDYFSGFYLEKKTTIIGKTSPSEILLYCWEPIGKANRSESIIETMSFLFNRVQMRFASEFIKNSDFLDTLKLLALPCSGPLAVEVLAGLATKDITLQGNTLYKSGSILGSLDEQSLERVDSTLRKKHLVLLNKGEQALTRSIKLSNEELQNNKLLDNTENITKEIVKALFKDIARVLEGIGVSSFFVYSHPFNNNPKLKKEFPADAHKARDLMQYLRMGGIKVFSDRPPDSEPIDLNLDYNQLHILPKEVLQSEEEFNKYFNETYPYETRNKIDPNNTKPIKWSPRFANYSADFVILLGSKAFVKRLDEPKLYQVTREAFFVKKRIEVEEESSSDTTILQVLLNGEFASAFPKIIQKHGNVYLHGPKYDERSFWEGNLHLKDQELHSVAFKILHLFYSAKDPDMGKYVYRVEQLYNDIVNIVRNSKSDNLKDECIKLVAQFRAEKGKQRLAELEEFLNNTNQKKETTMEPPQIKDLKQEQLKHMDNVEEYDENRFIHRKTSNGENGKFYSQLIIDDLTKDGTGCTKKVLIAALPGFGNNTLAKHVVRREEIINYFNGHIWWIDATSVETIEESFKKLLQKIELAGMDVTRYDNLPHKGKIDFIQNLFSELPKTLWVFSNVGIDEKKLESYIPTAIRKSKDGHHGIIITSENKEYGQGFVNSPKKYSLGPFLPNESRDFLKNLGINDTSISDRIAKRCHHIPHMLNLAANKKKRECKRNPKTIENLLDTEIFDKLMQRIKDNPSGERAAEILAEICCSNSNVLRDDYGEEDDNAVFLLYDFTVLDEDAPEAKSYLVVQPWIKEAMSRSIKVKSTSLLPEVESVAKKELALTSLTAPNSPRGKSWGPDSAKDVIGAAAFQLEQLTQDCPVVVRPNPNSPTRGISVDIDDFRTKNAMARQASSENLPLEGNVNVNDNGLQPINDTAQQKHLNSSPLGGNVNVNDNGLQPINDTTQQKHLNSSPLGGNVNVNDNGLQPINDTTQHIVSV